MSGRISAILGLCLFLTQAIISGPLDLKVVHPKPGQAMPAVDSTFIFGSVEPRSNLYINGHPVKVHKKGGWLAFLAVRPGAFDFSLRAEKNGLVDTLTLTVNLPELPEHSYDSLYFIPGSIQPSGSLWVKPGDPIEVSFTATPYCNASCIIANTDDTIPMKELPPQHYYRGRNVFQDGMPESSRTADSLLVRGVYRGSFVVPDIGSDSLILIYNIYSPSFMQLTWMIKNVSELRTRVRDMHDLGALPPIKADTSQIPITVLSKTAPSIVELTDSTTTIRTGPRKGYLCIHQPAGIRAELAGRVPGWLKLKLSDYQYGWIPDTAGIILPSGTALERSYINRIKTIDHDNKVSIIVSTSARHPFRIFENIEEKSITIFIYGASGDTDWIRYDNRDSLIDHIVWSEPEPGLYALKVYLTDDKFWGYDGYYVDDEFRLDIKRFPEDKIDIADYRFVIDPGHGPDPGAVGPTGLTEKEANLLIALQLKKDLKREGAEVILTRSVDTTLPLYDRPKIAVAEKADIFISIHNNALPDGSNPFVNNGVSTLYYHPHSAKLARAVQNSLSRKIKLSDFGWYYGNLAVNRPTQYPAILVECAFMMIPEQEAMLKTDKFRRKLSRAIVEGVKDFLRGGALTDWDIQQNESYGR